MQKNLDTPWKSKMRKKFYEDLFSKEGYYNSVLLTKEKYDSIIKDIKRIKTFKEQESTRDYRLIERYDIYTIEGCEKLIKPKSESEKNPKIYVHSDELFDILYSTHTSNGHGGRDKMLKQIRAQYKNITRAQLKLFLDLCECCHPKGDKKATLAENFRTTNFNNRSHVYFIDFQSQPDENFNSVLIYQENSTKFIVLKPLKALRAEEVTQQLFDIFLMIGAPCILNIHSENKLCNEIIDTVRPIWSQIKLVQGKPSHGRNINIDNYQELNQEIKELLRTWMIDNKTTKWTERLGIVQFMKNTAFNSEVEKSPYEAMFGSRIKLKLDSKYLPKKVYNESESVPDLQLVMIKNEPRCSMDSLSSLNQDPFSELEQSLDSFKEILENTEVLVKDEKPSSSKETISLIQTQAVKRTGETAFPVKDPLKRTRNSLK